MNFQNVSNRAKSEGWLSVLPTNEPGPRHAQRWPRWYWIPTSWKLKIEDLKLNSYHEQRMLRMMIVAFKGKAEAHNNLILNRTFLHCQIREWWRCIGGVYRGSKQMSRAKSTHALRGASSGKGCKCSGDTQRSYICEAIGEFQSEVFQ